MQPANPMTVLCVGGILLFVLCVIAIFALVAATNVVFALILARAAPAARREWVRRMQSLHRGPTTRDDRAFEDMQREQTLALDIERELETALNGLL